MIARQQLARLLPLALLVVLAIVGLRGAVPAPRWNGPLRAEGVVIGIALEVVLGVLLVITLRRDRAARHAAATRPYSEADDEIGVPAALRFALKWLLGGGMVAVAAVLISNLHFFIKPQHPRPVTLPAPPVVLPKLHKASAPLHIPVGPILYALLVLALVAAVAISLWWASRLRHLALPRLLPDAADADELREAVESGRLAFAELDDARAAIIACYVAMEGSLADQGAARGAADTPDELLARVISAGIVRGPAARRLTGLFYEARFSTHPLGRAERDAASAALDELAAELGASAEVAT
ncbi:MAG: DUF4129 domain-containing protein [Trebonia sp.]